MDMGFTIRALTMGVPGTALLALGLSQAAISADPPAPEGAALYKEHCAACHENPDPATSRAPNRNAIAARGPDAIYAALTDGPMKAIAAGLSPAERDAIALYLTGKAPSHSAAAADPIGEFASQSASSPPALAAPPAIDPAAGFCKVNGTPVPRGPSWNGWSPTLDNARYVAQPGLAAGEVAKLKVKWALAFTGGVGSQPTVVGGRVYLGTGAGQIYALDAKTGCIHWRTDAKGPIRAALSVGSIGAAPGKLAVFAGDRGGGVRAFDAGTGQELWSVKLETNPFATITGAPVLYQGRLYVPMSSSEEISPYVKGYQCCHFRGQVIALDAATGKEIWRTYTIADEPKAYRKAPDGTPVFGPAGAAIWSAPTIDPERDVLYVATGDSYTDVPNLGSDAVVAMNLDSGKIAWTRQITADDNYLVGCTGKDGQPSSCPLTVGPDHDFGASPILRRLPGGRRVLMVGQKSGEVTALDPDHQGAILWRNRLSPGSALGGIEWGMSADEKLVFAPIADPYLPKEEAKRGLYALRIADGTLAWAAPAPEPDCAVAPKGSLINICTGGLSATPTAIPGVVFAGSMDGILRAYDAASGKVVWSENLGQTSYRPLNTAAPMKGDTMNAGGPTVAGGALYVISGYQSSNPKAANLLLAFTPGGK
jgi:polyvinyl alcohol dehydrogenase (cytochrome)